MTTFEGRALDTASGVGALTLGGFLAEVGASHAAAEALVFDDPLLEGATVRWTYDDLEREARAIAAGLIAKDVGHSTRVAVVMGNRPEAVASIFGIALAGGVAVPLSTFSTSAELRLLLAHSAAAGVLTQTPPAPGRARRRDRRTGGRRRAPLPRLERRGRRPELEPPARRRPWPTPTRSPPVRRSSAPAIPASSSSAPGRPAPRRACCTSTGPRRSSSGCRPTSSGAPPTRRVWAPLPLFWTAGFTTAMGATLAGGGCFVLQETFDAGDALRLLARERVTEPYTLPHQARALFEHPDWDATDLSSLREVYGKSVFTRHPTVAGRPDAGRCPSATACRRPAPSWPPTAGTTRRPR